MDFDDILSKLNSGEIDFADGTEGSQVLASIKSSGGVDPERAPRVSEIILTIVKCASESQIRTNDYYRRVVSLVKEFETLLFENLDGSEYEKFHKSLESYLLKTALLLVDEIKCDNVDLIYDFYSFTLNQHKKSHSPQDQSYEAARIICSTLFSKREEIIFDVLVHVLDYMAVHSRNRLKNTTPEFLELVCYCAYECQTLTAGLCKPVAEYLYRLANFFPKKDSPSIRSILRLYARGLFIQSKGKDIEKRSDLQVLLSKKKLSRQVAAAIQELKGQLDTGGSEFLYQSPYWKAVKFLFRSLADSIISNMTKILSEASSKKGFGWMHEAFNQFCHIFLQRFSATEREREEAMANHTVISSVVVAALMLSFITNQNNEESIKFVNHVISATWVPVKSLKYLYSHICGIAVILNEKKQLKEAIEAFKLGCKASWNCVVVSCEMHVSKSQGCDDVSENNIADSVTDGSKILATLLELNRDGYSKISGIITESLLCWCNSNNLIETLPTPVTLMKKWVEIQYELFKESKDRELLYSFISSSEKISKKSRGKLLEEELVAYDSYLNLPFCLKMRRKVIEILLKEVYVTNDGILKKCEFLIEKAKTLRACEPERMHECIQILLTTISTLEPIYSEGTSCSYRVHHLLIHAYILHAICTQEAVPNCMFLSHESDFCHNINGALKICLSHNHDHDDETEDIYVWYELIDFLSIKGNLGFHPRLCDVVIKLFSKKNFSLTKMLAELWKNKRLTHALCASPVTDALMETFSKHHIQLCKSSEVWNMCLEELKPLVVGFQHINEIKQSASDLISNGPLTCSSDFLLSKLYYDLSGTLISSGRMTEALTYAKEAYLLRSKLWAKKFRCRQSMEDKTETLYEGEQNMNISQYCKIKFMRVTDFGVRKGSVDYEGCVLTPWNVLSCYLESILQLGSVYEILGAVHSAEKQLRWGKDVAQFQGLPLFEISFSCVLGKVYRKKKLWNAAEKELSNAQRMLKDNLNTISCKKCSCILEVSISQQLGDLLLSSSYCIEEPDFAQRQSNAKSLYKSALDKLNLCDWRDSYSILRSGDVQTGPASGAENLCNAAVGSDHAATKNTSTADFQSGILSLCNNMKCLECPHSGCSNLNSFMCMNWVLVHRKLSLRLLMSIGKFSGTFGHVYDAHQILLQIRNSFCSKHSSDSLGSLIEKIGKQFPGESVLVVERAALLYHICWFTVKGYQGTRNSCCELSCMGTTKIISILKQAFILSRGVPFLFQKISRLLATIYVLSTSLEQFSLPPNELEHESMWASFYHQASVGTLVNQQILSAIVQKKQRQNSEGTSLLKPVPDILDLPCYLRPAPESCEDLQEFVQKIFQGLPSSPVICISLVSGVDACLLSGLLDCSPEVKAWFFLSHLSSDDQHVVVLPVLDILGGDSSEDKLSSFVYTNSKNIAKWECPWGSSVIDDIAPVFRDVLEGQYCSAAKCVKENRTRHWEKLDKLLEDFLSDMEEVWLGTWKYLLLGKWPDRNCLVSKQASPPKADEDNLQLVLSKKCYVGQRSKALPKLFKEKLGMSDKTIILVLDIDVQMLPWENLPILRKQEVYRMPSIVSLFATFDKFSQNQECTGTSTVPVSPIIDPMDSYYLLNPCGELMDTQNTFESWFKKNKIEGKIGRPEVKELSLALRDHDLYIYMGHGSGEEFITYREFEKLESCAAALLLGCRTACFDLQGSYILEWDPLPYLLAGSPFVVANLWDVLTTDIDTFGKALLTALFEKRAAKCPECKVSSMCNHREMIASCMGKARNCCQFRYLTGAATVCYGVPTGIMNREK